jgi:hypothetical protein
MCRFVDAAAAEQLPKPRLNVNPPLEGGRPVGLLGAMPQEIANLRAHVQNQVGECACVIMCAFCSPLRLLGQARLDLS